MNVIALTYLFNHNTTTGGGFLYELAILNKVTLDSFRTQRKESSFTCLQLVWQTPVSPSPSSYIKK